MTRPDRRAITAITTRSSRSVNARPKGPRDSPPRPSVKEIEIRGSWVSFIALRPVDGVALNREVRMYVLDHLVLAQTDFGDLSVSGVVHSLPCRPNTASLTPQLCIQCPGVDDRNVSQKCLAPSTPPVCLRCTSCPPGLDSLAGAPRTLGWIRSTLG